jgi:hypothetical protein
VAQVTIQRNEVPDPDLAHRFAQELAEAAAPAESDEPLVCVIIDEGFHAEIEIEMTGWTEHLHVPYPARSGDVRRAVRRLLRELGLVAETAGTHLTVVSRGF